MGWDAMGRRSANRVHPGWGTGGGTPGSGLGTEMEALALVQLLFSGGAAGF